MSKQFIIQVDELQLSFEDGTAFNFNDINITKGKITGIIGPNGSGKTTFVEAVLGLRKLNKARIWIDGIPQKEFFKDNASRKNLGSQLQVFAFSELVKVSEMIALHKALYGKQSNRVYEALAMDELLNKRLDKLSGGQKQRINLYMALAHMPKLITLDEPSAALDKNMAERLIELLQYLSDVQNCSILVITHHPYELDICHEIMSIYGGAKTYHASREVFLNDIIGAFHAQIFIGDNENATLIQAEVNNIKNVKQHFMQGNQIDIYGQKTMEAGFLALIKKHQLKSYSFGQSNSADILKISTSFIG